MGALILHVRHAALLIAALSASGQADAQTYKWVDERGQTTYSNTPPTVGKLPKRIDPVAERVSVYTPDATITRAMEEDRRNDGKVKYVERQLNNERRQQAGADPRARQGAYERCVAERRVDCESLRSGSPVTEYDAIPYYSPVYVFGARPSPFAQPLVPPAPFVEPRVGVDNRPPVGIDNRPPVGIDSRPPVGIDSRPPVGSSSSPASGTSTRGRALSPLR